MKQTHTLLDFIIEVHKLKNDRGLSRVLEVGQPTISKIRSRYFPVSSDMILRMHEKLGMPVAEIRKLIAMSENDPK